MKSIDSGRFSSDPIHCEVSKIGKLLRSEEAQPYRFSETSLMAGSEITVLKTSDDLGWSDFNVSLVAGRPHSYEVECRPVPDLWLSMPLDPQDVLWAIEGRQERLTAGLKISIVAPKTALSIQRLTYTRGLHVFMKWTLLAELCRELFGRDISDFEVSSVFEREDASVAWLLRSLKQAMLNQTEHSAEWGSYIVRALAVDLLNKYFFPGDLNSPPKAEIERLSSRQARLVDDFIQENISSNISLNDLVAVAGMSRAVFVRRFKGAFGRTPHQYLMHVRLELAAELLSQGLLSIAEIADRCGFSDQSHFCVGFKRARGISPTRYRKLLRI